MSETNKTETPQPESQSPAGNGGCIKRALKFLFVLFGLYVAYNIYGAASQTMGPIGWGPFKGTVYDAETKQPIKGAQIHLEIRVGAFGNPSVGIAPKVQTYDNFSETDSKGNYKIKGHSFLFQNHADPQFQIIIYKAGYIAYAYEESCGKVIKRRSNLFDIVYGQDFKVKKNEVFLHKWDDKKLTYQDRSHHADFIRWPCSYDPPKSIRYCEEMREEMILACMQPDAPFMTRRRCEEIFDQQISR